MQASLPLGVSVLVLALLVPVGEAGADTVSDRIAAMKKMDKAVRRIADAMEGGSSPYDPAYALAQAETIKNESGRIVSLFPAGSLTDDSSAQPEIWKSPKKFEQAADEVIKKADQLLAAVKADQRERAAEVLKNLNRACSNCHATYRKKD